MLGAGNHMLNKTDKDLIPNKLVFLVIGKKIQWKT